MSDYATKLVDPSSISLGSLLALERFEVPDNQRDFSWEEEQFEKFWKDLQRTAAKNYSNGCLADTPEPHFLGAIVTERVSHDRARPLIDGQQRLVTSTVLYSVLHEFAARVSDATRSQTMQSEILQRIALLGGGIRVPRLRLGESHDFYDAFIVQRLTHAAREDYYQGLPKPSRVAQRLRKCEQYFFNSASQELGSSTVNHIRLGELLATLAELVVTVVLTVPSSRVAYRIFETLNERGLDLTQADLIKNEMLRVADQQGTKNEVLDHWKRVRSTLADTDEAMTMYIRYAFCSRHDSVRPTDLFDAVQGHLRTRSAADYAQELEVEAPAFAAIVNAAQIWGPEIAGYLEDIRRLDISHGYPLLLSAAARFGGQPSELRRVFKATRDFCFRFLTIGRNRPGQLELHIGQASRDCRDQSRSVDQILVSLKQQSSDAQFEADFARWESSAPRIQFHVLKLMEDHLAAGQGVTVLAHSPAQHIEHIMPQVLGNGWDHIKPDLLPVYLNRLGNLLVLERDINAFIKNKSFSEKFKNTAHKGYSNSVLKLPVLTRPFLKKKLWTVDSINERQAALARIALNVWPLA
jgi:hypothetical protein